MTGVQTCALPIFSPFGRNNKGQNIAGVQEAARGIFGVDAKDVRSEERRVGKECRSRWSPYH